mmetsp:Transcript_75843/g.180147  ORF Transcript_75843/g.180147 Transcript_75843/m.180147 type:complete len:221 (+) Transcript_75843:287-949(+)
MLLTTWWLLTTKSMDLQGSHRRVGNLADLLVVQIIKQAVCAHDNEISTLNIEDITFGILGCILLCRLTALDGPHQGFLALLQQLWIVRRNRKAGQLERTVERMLLLAGARQTSETCLPSNRFHPQLQEACIPKAGHAHVPCLTSQLGNKRSCSTKGAGAIITVLQHLQCRRSKVPRGRCIHILRRLSAAFHKLVGKCAGTALKAPLPLTNSVGNTQRVRG